MDNEITFLFIVFLILAIGVGMVVGNLYLQEGVGDAPSGGHGDDSSHAEPSDSGNHSGNMTGNNSENAASEEEH